MLMRFSPAAVRIFSTNSLSSFSCAITPPYQHPISLPASTRSAAAGTAAAKSAKSTAAAKSASAPSSAAVPTVSAAAKQKPPEYQPPERSKQYNQNNYYK